MRLLAAFIILFSILIVAGCLTLEKSGGVEWKQKIKQSSTNTVWRVNQPTSSKEPSTVQVNSDGSITVFFGSQYNVAKIKAVFASFRIWHIAALALIGAGVFLRVSSIVPNKYAYACIGTGFGCGIFAHVMPTYGVYVTFGLFGALLVAAVYYIWRRGLFTDVPDTSLSKIVQDAGQNK